MMTTPLNLQSLLHDIPNLKLEEFKTSSIRESIINGELEKGQQIWNFHNSNIDPNLAARINPYAHVVIYVGSREVTDKSNESAIVHVSNSACVKILEVLQCYEVKHLP